MMRCLLLSLLLSLSGCTMFRSQEESAAPSSVAGISLYEQRLINIFEKEQELERRRAQAAGDLPQGEVHRFLRELSYDYEALIGANPGQIEPLILYGKLLDRYGDTEGAFIQFVKADRIDPNVAVVNQYLGTYYAERQELGKALYFYLRAVELAPEEAVYQFGLGQLLAAYRDKVIENGIETEANVDRTLLSAFQRAAELEPANRTFQKRYGEAFYDVADPDWAAAQSWWQQLLDNAPSPLERDIARLHLARCLLEQGHYDQAKMLALQTSEPGLRSTQDSLLERIAAATTVGDQSPF